MSRRKLGEVLALTVVTVLCLGAGGCKKKASAPRGPAFSTGGPGQVQPPAGMPSAVENRSEPATPIDFTGLERPQGGLTVGEIFAQADTLMGKEIKVRGKVVKFNPSIMGVNWLHLQDGTGTEGLNDLTVKTLSQAKAGDTVLVTGTLTTGGESFHGGNYSAVVENGTAIVE